MSKTRKSNSRKLIKHFMKMGGVISEKDLNINGIPKGAALKHLNEMKNKVLTRLAKLETARFSKYTDTKPRRDLETYVDPPSKEEEDLKEEYHSIVKTIESWDDKPTSTSGGKYRKSKKSRKHRK
jgi:hypothetical protein